jgi:hypothetical protein
MSYITEGAFERHQQLMNGPNGKADILARGDITMSHDDLLSVLGSDAAAKIADAGFVLVPRKWREDTFLALGKVPK